MRPCVIGPRNLMSTIPLPLRGGGPIAYLGGASGEEEATMADDAVLHALEDKAERLEVELEALEAVLAAIKQDVELVTLLMEREEGRQDEGKWEQFLADHDELTGEDEEDDDAR